MIKDSKYFSNLVREFFIARPNQLLISADYEQLEPTIFAHTSGDPALQRIFHEGLDFYSTVAINTEGLVEASSHKLANNYLGKINKGARQKAKSYSLGIAYGMTGYKLKFEIGCSQEEADELVGAYLTAFPKLKEWMDESRTTVKNTGRIRTQAGRVRHMPQAKALAGKYGPCIEDDLELWKRYHSMPGLYAQAKKDRKTYKNLLNNSINFQVQGLAASIMNRAGIAIVRRCLREGLAFPFRAQVHDEWVAEALTGAKANYLGALMQEEMQNVMALSVPLRTTPQYGSNYRQCK